MRTASQFSAPHEPSVFFLKSILLSFCIGLDVIAVLTVSRLSYDTLSQYRFLFICVLAILIVCTVFATLLAWGTGSSSGRQSAAAEEKTPPAGLHHLKRGAYQLRGAGAISVCALVMVIHHCAGLPNIKGEEATLLSGASLLKQTGMAKADSTIAKKCAEVARLEHRFFQTNENTVLAQCMAQYQPMQVALNNSEVSRKQ